MVKQNRFEIRINNDFANVIERCSVKPRPGQFGTWITDDMKTAYQELHRLKYSHSFEAYQDGRLVGGLYGIVTGSVFAGRVCLQMCLMHRRLLLYGLSIK